MTRKVGRPPLPAGRKVRNQRISIDYKTYKIILKQAKKQGLTIKETINKAFSL